MVSAGMVSVNMASVDMISVGMVLSMTPSDRIEKPLIDSDKACLLELSDRTKEPLTDAGKILIFVKDAGPPSMLSSMEFLDIAESGKSC